MEAAINLEQKPSPQALPSMKVVLERDVFLKALNHSQGVVEKKTTVPILSHILLEAHSDHLTLTATDLEVSIVEVIPAKIEAPGKVTVSAHTLYDIVRKCKEGAEISLSFEPAHQRVLLFSNNSQFALPCLPAAEFPVINAGKQPYKFRLSAKTLMECLERTRFAMSTEETRYYLNGIYLHAFEGKELRAVATDGHRLAKMSFELPQGADSMPGIILSRKTVNEALKLAAEQVVDVDVSLSETQVSFRFSDVYFTSRLVDGKFPDYEKVIPAHNQKMMAVDMDLFSEAVDRVATISSEKNRGIRLSLKSGKLTLSATNTDSGSSREEIPVDYAGDSLELGFNSRYLLDIGQQLSGERAEFAFSDPSAPVIIRGVGQDDVLYVLMPMRV
jgi:DNA polymerase-3 subunit beta